MASARLCPKCNRIVPPDGVCYACSTATSPANKTWLWIVVAICIGGCLFWGAIASMFNSPKSPDTFNANAYPSTPTPENAKPAAPPAQKTLTTGSKGEVFNGTDDVFVARDEDSYDKLNRAAAAKDAYGMAELMLAGKVFTLASRTKILVIDAGFFSHTVRVLDGPHRGKSAIIAREFVKRTD